MQVYYSNQIEGKTAFFSEDESMHIIKVMRIKKGQTIHVIDGMGSLFEAVIEDESSKKASAIITKLIDKTKENKYYIHIAIAPTKNNDRTELFVEKAIEMGIDEISFIKCRHSERDILKMDRIERLALSAAKQSQKYKLPKLNELTDIKKFINQLSTDYDTKAIAYLDDKPLNHLADIIKKDEKYIVLIGPEGDFNKEEVELVKTKGFEAVSLGPNRLRTETAGIAAAWTFNLANR
jgi:16S rRNA (uracil1498-N3)-methyltransferase